MTSDHSKARSWFLLPGRPSKRYVRSAVAFDIYAQWWKLSRAVTVAMVTTFVLILSQTSIGRGVARDLYQNRVVEETAGFETRLSASIVSHIASWNDQPDSLRYHAADRFSPRSRSCNCYAPWLNQTVEETCQQVETLAVQQNKPVVRLGISTGWYNNRICADDTEHPTGSFDCPISLCRFSLISVKEPTIDYGRFDGVLHYSGDWNPDFSGKPPAMPWYKLGYIYEEPPFDYNTAEDYRRRHYDVAFTYLQPQDMPESSYFQTSLLELPVELFTHFKPPAWSSRLYNVASIVSHCVPERAQLVKEFSDKIEVHRFGKCESNFNAEELHPECQESGLWWEQQRCLIGNYKFYMAFENSQSSNYVTEKLWQPLLMGAIPIYWGAPNVDDYLPHPDAIIRVSDFESMDALAEYVQFLLDSDESVVYKKHLAWRDQGPLPQRFLDQFETTPGRAPCHLCDMIAKDKELYTMTASTDGRRLPLKGRLPILGLIPSF